MLQWNIQSRGRHCAITHRAFADGEICHTVLVEGRQGFERMDLSPAAWADGGRDILARPGVLSHWQGRYQAPPAAPPDAIQKSDADSLLRGLLERREAAYEPACFILAAMLERKKALRARGQSRDGGRRLFFYEHAASGDTFQVVDPELKLDQLEAVQRQVAELLERGLPPAPSDANAERADAPAAASATPIG